MDFGERSQAYVPFVLREWRLQARGRAPWSAMPLDDLAGDLPGVVGALLEEVIRREGGAGAGRAAALDAAAARHGAFRRRQGCSSSIIAGDYDLLRRAIRSTLRSGGIAVHRMAGVLYETLVALRTATRASMREFAETGPREWDGSHFLEEES